jgi:hypothetical protein
MMETFSSLFANQVGERQADIPSMGAVYHGWLKCWIPRMTTWEYSVQAADTVIQVVLSSHRLFRLAGAVILRRQKSKALKWISPPIIPHPCWVARVGDEATGKALWTPVLLGGDAWDGPRPCNPAVATHAKTKWRRRSLRKHAPLEEAGCGARSMFPRVLNTCHSDDVSAPHLKMREHSRCFDTRGCG